MWNLGTNLRLALVSRKTTENLGRFSRLQNNTDAVCVLKCPIFKYMNPHVKYEFV
jgi:hypothetical protein